VATVTVVEALPPIDDSVPDCRSMRIVYSFKLPLDGIGVYNNKQCGIKLKVFLHCNI